MYLILPAESSITYTVEITNKVSDSYLIDSIDEISNTNNNVGVDLSLNINDLVNSNSTKTFTITITNETLSEQYETLVIEYGFKINRFTLTINSNGGIYNDSTSMSTIQQGYNTYYGLNTPTREGYTFDGWELSGSGDIVRGDASGYGYSSSRFTYTSKIDTDGSPYSNYKVNYFNSSSYIYPNVSYSQYNFIVGHTYRITSIIRLNEQSNIEYFNIRHSAVGNDCDTPNRAYIYIPTTAIGAGWITYTMNRTFDSLTTTHFGSTLDVTPLFEIYCQISPNQNGIIDFDVKNVIIEDITDGTQISNGTYNGYIYKFGSENATLTAKWVTTMDNNVVEYDYTGSSQEFIAPKSGTYKIELWGGQGGGNSEYVNGGYGGYTSGKINLNDRDYLYLYIGGLGNQTISGNSDSSFGGYNGGGDAIGQSKEHRVYGAGGGATDVRLLNGNWDNFNSLKSRLMVAAGGGGSYNELTPRVHRLNGGSSGGLNGYDGLDNPFFSPTYGTRGTGETQNEGGFSTTGDNTAINWGLNEHFNNGGFGYGGVCTNGLSCSGGGAGYYGGGASLHVQSAGGGSSFISGHSGCDAIDKDSTSDNIIHTGQANHYSSKVFTKTIMIDGDGCKWTSELTNDCSGQLQPDGTTATGHTGNGFARITFIE